MNNQLLEELAWRGMLLDKTEGVDSLFAQEGPVTAYIGFDPTADSLHVGSLLPIMGLVHFQRCGHKPIALVGGATGMIGDPSGKSKERNLLTPDILAHNVACIHAQLEKFLDFETEKNPARLVNNADWIGPMSFIEFMRDVGKHFSVGAMLAKESVKRRVSEAGISFTEFGYMILQSHDFYHLNKEFDCTLQMGGSDQWGNITAGADLIRRRSDGTRKAHGIVFPLVKSASGTKFGKTEDGAVWLDANRTSPYRFYQFWLNTPDADALGYLKAFTTLSREEVDALAEAQEAAPHKREVQHKLAGDITSRVHGEQALQAAIQASRAMFGGDLDELSGSEVGDIFNEVPSTEIARSSFEGEGCPILQLFTDCGVTKSNGEARRLCQGNGMNLNNRRITDVKRNVVLDDAIEGKYLVLRKGGKTYHLVKLRD